MYFDWEKPTSEILPSLSVRGMIERDGGNSQHPTSTFHFKQDLIIVTDILTDVFQSYLYRKGLRIYFRNCHLKKIISGFLIGILKL